MDIIPTTMVEWCYNYTYIVIFWHQNENCTPKEGVYTYIYIYLFIIIVMIIVNYIYIYIYIPSGYLT